MTLSRYEQETTISYNNEEKTAIIYTCDKSLIRKLDEMARKDSTIIETTRDEYSKTYPLRKQGGVINEAE